MQSTVFRGHVAACCYSSVVGMSVWVCLCVGHDREPCKNRWTDRDAIWAGADSRGFKKRCITLGVHFGTFWRMRWIDLCGSGDAYCRYHYYSNFLLVLTPWQSWAILVNFDKENRTESWFSWMRFVLNAVWQTALQRREFRISVEFPVEFRGDLWQQKTRFPGVSCGLVCVILRFAVLIEHRLVTDTDTVSALLRGNWQDYYWQDASRGYSAIAELLVEFYTPSKRLTSLE